MLQLYRMHAADAIWQQQENIKNNKNRKKKSAEEELKYVLLIIIVICCYLQFLFFFQRFHKNFFVRFFHFANSTKHFDIDKQRTNKRCI